MGELKNKKGLAAVWALILFVFIILVVGLVYAGFYFEKLDFGNESTNESNFSSNFSARDLNLSFNGTDLVGVNDSGFEE